MLGFGPATTFLEECMKGKLLWIVCTGIVMFLCLGQDANAFQCCGTTCCEFACDTECVDCTAGQGCSTTTTCLYGIPVIIPRCTAGSGGGSCDGCHRQICCQGAALDFAQVSAGEVMDFLTKQTGMKFQAGAIRDLSVDLRVAPMEFIAWTQEIGKQLGAVPVYRGAQETFEFIPRDLVEGFSYSLAVIKEPLDIGFTNMDTRNALLRIAQFSRIDIVIPSGLHGTVDADYTGQKLGWEDVLQDVLERTGNKGHVLVAPNGLVWISPHK